MFFKILIPFTFFATSRLNKLKNWIFQFIYEWIPNTLLVILFYEKGDLTNNLIILITSYLGFISIYEIGYIFNDLISTKFETNPRKRLGDYNPKWSEILILVIIRLITFGFISYYFFIKGLNIQVWFLLSIGLGIVFSLHNYLKYKPHKILTFLQLATIRIITPIFLIFSVENLKTIFISYFFCYIFYRTLIYIESKGILVLENRRSLKYTGGYYLIISVILCFFSFLFKSYIPILLSGYYLIIWTTLFGLKRDFG